MAQEIFNGLKNNQKTGTKHIIFQQNNDVHPSWGVQADQQSSPFTFSDGVLNISAFEKLKGEFDLASFPHLRKITFQEMQSNRIVLSYYEDTSRGVWVEKYKSLREQAMIPYLLVEDRKLEQLEAEIAELRQSFNHKVQMIADLNQKIQQTPTLSQFRELNNIVLGCTELNYNKLKQEIKRLKLKDFNPYFQEQKNTFERLMATAKNKAGDSLKSILDLLLQTNKQIIESEYENNNNNSFTRGQLQGQLTTCQTLLQTKFTLEELQSLLDKQKELRRLEKHSVILQQDVYK
ncbi:hypothetical protein F8M41_010654 [Gigaspora margarita]|uniref:Uncharacterized protein n=1 Tax=Gigaspora margarita TaxID=4874 RepID=A0A8H3X1E9_GIGMA|nr:hypothetical protein F8M41_010654 [Gigaspora margarita]